jgi:pyruvate dehydrogenase E1 component alpha subunit
MAAVWNLPSIFVCENNAYAESTPQSYHQKNQDVADRAIGYGMPSSKVDGNDPGAVYLAAEEAVGRARSGGGPTLIEAKTYRIRGHYEGDPEIYRTKEEVEIWKKKDPIERWRNVLLERGVPAETFEEIDARIDQELKDAVAFAEESPTPDPTEARSDIYTPLPAEIYND